MQFFDKVRDEHFMSRLLVLIASYLRNYILKGNLELFCHWANSSN